MRVRIAIEAKDALLAGVDDHGVKIVEIDPEELTEAEREVLACHPAEDDAEFELGSTTCPPQGICQYGGWINVPYTWLYATPEAVREWLQLATVARQERVAQRKAELGAEAEKHAKIRDELLLGEPESLLEKSYSSWRLVSHAGIESDPRFAQPLAEAATIRDQRNAEIGEARKAEIEADRAMKEEAVAEKSHWIAEYGSERLQRLAEEEIEHNAVYLDERLALERPGWAWYRDIECECDNPRNPPLDAFDVLDAARKVDSEAELAWGYVDWDEDEEQDEYSDEERDQYKWTGYCARAEFLGREIVLFGSDCPE